MATALAVLVLGFSERRVGERGAFITDPPVAGVPALERSLLWLTCSGVTEALVVCATAPAAAAAQQVVNAARWAGRLDLRVEVLHAAGCRSEGDALRAVYKRHNEKSYSDLC